MNYHAKTFLVVTILTFAGLPSARSQERNGVENPGTATLHARPGRGPKPASGAGALGFGWLGPAAITLVLAACGAASLLLKRTAARVDAARMRVVGRASITPRHSLALVQIGDRVLIVGHGPDGPPALLGEIDDPDEIERLLESPGAGRRAETQGESTRPDIAPMNTSQATQIAGAALSRGALQAPHIAITAFAGAGGKDA